MMMRFWIWALCSIVILIVPEYAYAQIMGIKVTGNLSCNGSVSTTNLFDNRAVGLGTCTARNPGDPFDFFGPILCIFETTLGLVAANIFCAISEAWREPLGALISLALVTSGIMFITGLLNLTLKDMAILAFKLGLVATFALNMDITLDVAYSLFINIMKALTDVVLGHISGGADPFQEAQKDVMVNWNAITTLANNCTGLMVAIVLLIAAPFLVSLFFFALMTYLMFFARAMYGFLFSFVIITFLIALTPVYASFALFNTTREMFNKWIEYLGSHSIQVVLVFAFLAMSDAVKPEEMIYELVSISTTYQPWAGYGPLSFFFSPTGCTICEPTLLNINGILYIDKTVGCTGKQPLEWTEISKNEKVITYLATRGGGLYLLVAAMDGFLMYVPELAKMLGGAHNAYTVGGVPRGMGSMSSGGIPSGFIVATQKFETGVRTGWNQSGARQTSITGRLLARTAPGRMISALTEGGKSAIYGESKFKTKAQARAAFRKESELRATVKEHHMQAQQRYKRVEQLYQRVQELEKDGKSNKALLNAARLRHERATKELGTSERQLGKLEKELNRSGRNRKDDGLAGYIHDEQMEADGTDRKAIRGHSTEEGFLKSLKSRRKIVTKETVSGERVEKKEESFKEMRTRERKEGSYTNAMGKASKKWESLLDKGFGAE